MTDVAHKAPRHSNLELLCILSMLAIVAHHSVTSSQALGYLDYNAPSASTYLLTLWGMWGKTAINPFIMISGYFLCTSRLTWQRYVKILFEYYFYMVVIMVIFMAVGDQPVSLYSIGYTLFEPLIRVNDGFTASFLAFYMFVPIYNVLIHALTKRQFALTIAALLLYLSVAPSLFGALSMNEPLWYATLYMIAAYIRLYPSRWTESARVAAITLVVGIMAAVASTIAIMRLISDPQLPGLSPETWRSLGESPFATAAWFVGNSNRILAFVIGVAAFLVAKNAPVFHSSLINTMAAGTFAVLLIHTANHSMVMWLWVDVFDIPSVVQGPALRMAAVMLVAPIAIFSAGSFIDYFRRRLIERPFMQWLHKRR